MSVLQATHAVSRFSSREWASTIDVPTAVVVTTRDSLVRPRRQYRLASSIPDSRVFEVEGDHLACVRVPERFVPTLLEACEWVRERSLTRLGRRR